MSPKSQPPSRQLRPSQPCTACRDTRTGRSPSAADNVTTRHARAVEGERPQSASEMTNDVAARNAIGVASAGREISSALCTAWAMSNRNSRRLPAIGQRALMARPLSAVQKEA